MYDKLAISTRAELATAVGIGQAALTGWSNDFKME